MYLVYKNKNILGNFRKRLICILNRQIIFSHLLHSFDEIQQQRMTIIIFYFLTHTIMFISNSFNKENTFVYYFSYFIIVSKFLKLFLKDHVSNGVIAAEHSALK